MSDQSIKTAPRVCIVAVHASFRFGGEASLPLHYFIRLRQKGIEAWLVIHERTRQEIEALLPEEKSRIAYLTDRWYHRFLDSLSNYVPRRIHENTFGTLMTLIDQLVQRKIVRALVANSGANVVHQPIPVSPRMPSYIADLGVPVVIGPMNGGMNYPAAFKSGESLFGRAFVRVARSSANLMNRLIPGKKEAAVILVANERTRNALPDSIEGRVIVMPENGVDLRIWVSGTRVAPQDRDARFVFVGRLVDWKRLDFALDALRQLDVATLDVIGDGPMLETWRSYARSAGLGDRVRWRGWLSQAECAAVLHGATALLLPSIYECGGAVVLEAMACKTPVIALKWGGPADYIDESCGVLIDPAEPAVIIRQFSAAMAALAADPDRARRMGECGRLLVEKLYDWDKKVDRMVEVYVDAIASAAS
jgi:glycosyltransferase involved in cell wall biosynthesis